MNRLQLAATIFICLLLCCCKQRQTANTATRLLPAEDALVRYIKQVQHIEIDSGPVYCILFFTENCVTCNYASKEIIDSICKLPLTGKLLIIISESTLPAPQFGQNKAIILKDYKGELAQYGLIYPRHMFFKLCNKSIRDSIEILPANQSGIFNSLNKPCN